MPDTLPVITIDGPSGSGKGTVTQRVADRLGWRVLDSGALYRLVGFAVDQRAVGFEDESKISEIAEHLNVEFNNGKIFLDGREVTDLIRTEGAGNNASRVAAMPGVRAALLDWQRGYAQPPGLVADGRDMGTVIFADAQLKIFLTASVEERARRRHKQLIEKGQSANLDDLLRDIGDRDRRDRERSAAPLRAADDALVIDSTAVDVSSVVQQILSLRERIATG